jgi:hypothetical protein
MKTGKLILVLGVYYRKPCIGEHSPGNMLATIGITGLNRPWVLGVKSRSQVVIMGATVLHHSLTYIHSFLHPYLCYIYLPLFNSKKCSYVEKYWGGNLPPLLLPPPPQVRPMLVTQKIKHLRGLYVCHSNVQENLRICKKKCAQGTQTNTTRVWEWRVLLRWPWKATLHPSLRKIQG